MRACVSRLLLAFYAKPCADMGSKQAFPRNYHEIAASSSSTDRRMWASFDGDADRVVMFYEEASKVVLLDGDKMACK